VAKGSVRDIDRGLNALLKRVGKKASLIVGVFGDAAAARAVDGDGATVGDIAAVHEFGQHARPWLRPAIDENEQKIAAAARKAARAVYEGEVPAKQAAAQMGLGIERVIKERMIAGIAPPLTDQYLARKLANYPGATTPLIASTQFLGAIASKVETGEDETK